MKGVKEEKRRGWWLLSLIERGGNALPHPASLFGIMALLVLVVSWLGNRLGWSAVHPVTGEAIEAVNLLSKEGLHRILLDMVSNYTGFAPLGIVMVALLGIGVMESSGMIRATVRLTVQKAPSSMLTFVIVLVGILSNIASDLGYILIIPIAGIIFHSVGRHPIAGMAAAFAGVSGGFSANIVIGTIDPLLAGLSTEAARIVDPSYYVLPTANYYFMAASSIVIALSATWVTTAIVEPRLGPYGGTVEVEPVEPLTRIERKALRWTGMVLLAWIAIFIWGLAPRDGFLRGPGDSVLQSPLLKGFIAVLFIVTTTLGIVYGVITKKFRSDGDVIKGMADSFKALVGFLVLVFFAAQFVAWFRWSNLGLILAIDGANWLRSVDIGMIPLLMLFLLFAGFVNLFMGSASAKWALLAPVFVPMFMLLGYSPELSQAVYRIGDSVTNIVSPMMSFFALIIVYFEKYDSNAGIGTLISTMLPYTVTFFIVWSVLLIGWVVTGIPLGPGSGIYYTP